MWGNILNPPAVKLEIVPNKKAVFVGEEVEFRGEISFFDDTPASYALLDVKDTSGNTIERITADENGRFIYRCTPNHRDDKYYPSYEWFSFELKQPVVKVNPKGRKAILVYGPKLKIEKELQQDGDKMKVRATVFNIDLASFNAGVSSEVNSGVVKGQKVILKPQRISYEMIEDGTYYDFVEKVTRTRYKYVTKAEILEVKELITDNNGQIEYEIAMSKDSRYEIEIIAKDKNGYTVAVKEYFSYYRNEIIERDGNLSNFSIHLANKKENFSVGERVEVKIFKDRNEYPNDEKNKFLFITANRGFLSPNLKKEPSFNFIFNEDHKPNIYVGAIVFTGKYYKKASSFCDSIYCGYFGDLRFEGQIVSYDEKISELAFDIKTSKPKYAPGEEVEINVNVKKEGMPVSGISVALVVVDESLDEIGLINEPKIGSSLYRKVSDKVYYSHNSHYLFLENHGGIGGSGGGDGLEVRKNFANTAYFGSVVTNDVGNAVFIFKIPDNITSWIVYAQGIDDNLNYGQIRSSIIATKDFFVTGQFPDTVIKGDMPSFVINSYGNVLKKHDRVSYTYNFLNKDGDKIISKGEFSEFSFKDFYVAFPILENGDYQIRTYGKYKQYEDAISLPLTVKPSRIRFETQKDFILEKGERINLIPIEEINDSEFIKVIIADQGKGGFYGDLLKYCYVDSNRIEKKLARIKASKILKKWLNEKDCDLLNSNLSEFQGFTGGIKQVKWGGGDVETSAWSAYVGAEFFDKDKLKNYFNSIVANPEVILSGEDRSKDLLYVYALWGLAILGDPKINQMIQIEKKLVSYREKVVLAYAFVASGQIEKARDLYYDLLSQYAYANRPYVRIQTGQPNMDSYLFDSSYALLLGSMVDQKYNEGLRLYLKDYRTLANGLVLDLAEVSFIDEQISSLPDEDTIFSIRIGNQLKRDTIKKGKGKTFVLSKNEAKNIELEVDSGKALVSINSYINNIDHLETDKRLSLSRNYSQIAGDSNSSEISLGEIIEVKLDYNFSTEAPAGMYCVKDHIPSGFTYIEDYILFKHIPSTSIMYEVAPNIVNACVCNLPWCFSQQNELVYYARASSAGKYVFEPAFIQYEKDRSILQKTEKETINVGNFSN